MGTRELTRELTAEMVESLSKAERERCERFRRRANYLEWIVTIMAIVGAFLLCAFTLIFCFANVARGEQLTIGWHYSKAFHDTLAGYRLYSGSSAETLDTLVADIPIGDVTATTLQPYLLNETFDTDPGDKYPLAKGSWTWVEQTKNMLVESDEFMIVFDKPAGAISAISFWFWPQKALGDQAQLYNYNKDMAESEATGVGVYYELRFGSSDGTRYSNFRKCYDGKYGGVDPNGAFPLQRFPECNIVEGQNNLCDGYWISVEWDGENYSATIYNQATKKTETVGGIDAKPLDISRLEIISKQQSFWIDDIRIGGIVDLRATQNISLPSPGSTIYLAMSAYRMVDGNRLEGAKSIPVDYIVPSQQIVPGSPKGLRKGSIP